MTSRSMRTTLRTLHVLAFSAYYGGHIFSVPAERLLPALVAVAATGVIFMVFEVWRSPVWLHQTRGVCTYIKLGLLACSAVFWEQRIVLLTLIMVLGVVVSHAPSQFRYYSVLHRKVISTHAKG